MLRATRAGNRFAQTTARILMMMMTTYLERMTMQMPRMRDPILIVDDQLDALICVRYGQQLLLESELQFELRAECGAVEGICLCDG